LSQPGARRSFEAAAFAVSGDFVGPETGTFGAAVAGEYRRGSGMKGMAWNEGNMGQGFAGQEFGVE
jgi:hypothetical protein